MKSEISTAITKLKTCKAPGIDRIGDLIKGGGDTIVKIMHKICNKHGQLEDSLNNGHNC